MESHADTGPASVPAGEVQAIGSPGRRGSTVSAGSTYFWANPPGPRGLDPDTEAIVINEPVIEEPVDNLLDNLSAVPDAEVDLLEGAPESEPEIFGDVVEQSPRDDVAVQAGDCDCLSCRFGQPMKAAGQDSRVT